MVAADTVAFMVEEAASTVEAVAFMDLVVEAAGMAVAVGFTVTADGVVMEGGMEEDMVSGGAASGMVGRKDARGGTASSGDTTAKEHRPSIECYAWSKFHHKMIDLCF